MRTDVEHLCAKIQDVRPTRFACRLRWHASLRQQSIDAPPAYFSSEVLGCGPESVSRPLPTPSSSCTPRTLVLVVPAHPFVSVVLQWSLEAHGPLACRTCAPRNLCTLLPSGRVHTHRCAYTVTCLSPCAHDHNHAPTHPRHPTRKHTTVRHDGDLLCAVSPSQTSVTALLVPERAISLTTASLVMCHLA